VVARSTSAPILVVDDNEETREVLQQVLEIKGYPTVEARGGPEALRYLRDGNPVSLIILDISMPGMDGAAVHAELKADPWLSHIPVIVFSGVDAQTRVEGVVAYVRKGVNPDVLLSFVAQTYPRT
jgi:CheY-like chemotaxis protein